jgi:hypothetical protein
MEQNGITLNRLRQTNGQTKVAQYLLDQPRFPGLLTGLAVGAVTFTRLVDERLFLIYLICSGDGKSSYPEYITYPT